LVNLLVRGPGSCLTSFEHDVEVAVNHALPVSNGVKAKLVLENPDTLKEVADKLGFKAKLKGDAGGLYELSVDLETPESDVIAVSAPDAYLKELSSYVLLDNVKSLVAWWKRSACLAALLRLYDEALNTVYIVEFWARTFITPFTRDKATLDMTGRMSGAPNIDYEKSLIEDAYFKPQPQEETDRFKASAQLEGAPITDFDRLKAELIWRDEEDNIVRIDILDLQASGSSQMEKELGYPYQAKKYDVKAYWRSNKELSSKLTVKLMPMILRAV